MGAKRPRIDSGPKVPPTQFFSPYPEDDDDDEEEDGKLGRSKEDQSSDTRVMNNLNKIDAEQKRHKCMVCDRQRILTELVPFTTDQHKLRRWVNSVRWTSEGRRSLMEQLSAIKCSFLCASHFLPSDFNLDSSRIDLRPDAVPLFVGSSTESANDLDAPLSAPEMQSDIKKEPMEIKEEPIDKFTDIKQEEPIADIYCPSTGTSRPIGPMDLPSREIFEKPEELESIKSYVCPECGKIHGSVHSLEYHLRIHTGVKGVICPYCGVILRTVFIRDGHIQTVHKMQVTAEQPEVAEFMAVMENSYICPECDKKLYTKRGFDMHMLTHKGKKSLQCPHCGRCFRSISFRDNHIRRDHRKQPYGCLTCNERFDSYDDWRRHLAMSEGHQAANGQNSMYESHLEEEPEESNYEEPGPSRRS